MFFLEKEKSMDVHMRNIRIVLSGEQVMKVIGYAGACNHEINQFVYPFVGVATDRENIVRRGVGIGGIVRILFFEPFDGSNDPVCYWRILQIIRRLQKIDLGILRDAIVVGGEAGCNFTGTVSCGDVWKQYFEEVRTQVLKEAPSEEVLKKIAEGFVHCGAPLVTNNSKKIEGGKAIDRQPVREAQPQIAAYSPLSGLAT
jgi:hypothetical protein